MGDFWHLNPALITGLATAVMTAMVAFGLPITDPQKVSILGIVGAVWALAQALIVRHHVTPNKNLEDAGLDPEEVRDQAVAVRAARKTNE